MHPHEAAQVSQPLPPPPRLSLCQAAVGPLQVCIYWRDGPGRSGAWPPQTVPGVSADVHSATPQPGTAAPGGRREVVSTAPALPGAGFPTSPRDRRQTDGEFHVHKKGMSQPPTVRTRCEGLLSPWEMGFLFEKRS